ncbi:MAG: hypothetical protein IKP40_08410 [Clostridia bacterium]|nr:hypothetical protein [Clostridia bacterium]
MAISNFIPKVWSARLLEGLHKQLVLGRLCNRNWEGEIRDWGDTVHINSLSDITVRPYVPGTDLADPEAIDGTDQTLVIDHGVYCNFYIRDVDAAQARADLMDAAMRSAARCLAEDTETYLLGVMRAGAGITGSVSLAGGAYEALLTIKTALDTHNVPRAGRKLVMPSSVEAELLRDTRFASAGGAIGEHVLAEGAIARACGFDIYISNDLTDEILALTEDGVTFAQQISRMEAYRREKGFDDGVKGLSLCGAKVVQPDCLALFTVTA